MARSGPLAALVALGCAAALAVAAPASAAPPAPDQAARAAQAEKRQAIEAIRHGNRAYAILRAKVTVCARPPYPSGAPLRYRARAELRRAAQLRLNALVTLRATLPARQLRTRQQALARANRALRAVDRLCIQARRPGARAAGTVLRMPGSSVPGAPPDATVAQVPVTLGDLLGIDRLLPEGLLPGTLTLADSLVPGLLTTANGVVTIEPARLAAVLRAVVDGAVPACRPLDVSCLVGAVLATVERLLAGVDAALAEGNVRELVALGDPSGNVLRVIPLNGLAELLAALPTEALTGHLTARVGLVTVVDG